MYESDSYEERFKIINKDTFLFVVGEELIKDSSKDKIIDEIRDEHFFTKKQKDPFWITMQKSYSVYQGPKTNDYIRSNEETVDGPQEQMGSIIGMQFDLFDCRANYSHSMFQIRKGTYYLNSASKEGEFVLIALGELKDKETVDTKSYRKPSNGWAAIGQTLYSFGKSGGRF